MDRIMLEEAGHQVRRFGGVNPAGKAAVPSLAMAPWNPVQTRALRRTLRAWEPDIAHVHNTWFALSPAVVRTLVGAGVPTVVTFHNTRQFSVDGGSSPDHRMLSTPNRLLWRDAWRGRYRNSRALSILVALTSSLHHALHTWSSANLTTVPSEALRQLFITRGYDPDQIVVTPWTTPDPGPRTVPPSESRDICFFGRLERQKGITQLLQGWLDASPELDDLRLRVFGSGELADEVTAAAAASRGRIEHRDWASPDEVALAMRSARGVVIPSLAHEVFGFVAIEAMAAGAPVLATDRGALPETVGQIDPRLLVQPEEPGAWARALPLLRDATFVDRQGERAREVYERCYRPEHGRERLLDVYASVLRPQG